KNIAVSGDVDFDVWHRILLIGDGLVFEIPVLVGGFRIRLPFRFQIRTIPTEPLSSVELMQLGDHPTGCRSPLRSKNIPARSAAALLRRRGATELPVCCQAWLDIVPT